LLPLWVVAPEPHVSPGHRIWSWSFGPTFDSSVPTINCWPP
jgi:hypothetical protein